MDKNIKKMLEAGRIYYIFLPPKYQERAFQLLKQMDINDNDRLSPQEIIEYLISHGVDSSEIRSVIDVMKHFDKRELDITDAAALWYSFTMRPICKNCGILIPEIYYSCLTCFRQSTIEDDYTQTYDLCPPCFLSKSYHHDIPMHEVFLDNFVLLRIKNHVEYVDKVEQTRRIRSRRSFEEMEVQNSWSAFDRPSSSSSLAVFERPSSPVTLPIEHAYANRYQPGGPTRHIFDPPYDYGVVPQRRTPDPVAMHPTAPHQGQFVPSHRDSQIVRRPNSNQSGAMGIMKFLSKATVQAVLSAIAAASCTIM